MKKKGALMGAVCALAILAGSALLILLSIYGTRHIIQESVRTVEGTEENARIRQIAKEQNYKAIPMIQELERAIVRLEQENRELLAKEMETAGEIEIHTAETDSSLSVGTQNEAERIWFALNRNQSEAGNVDRTEDIGEYGDNTAKTYVHAIKRAPEEAGDAEAQFERIEIFMRKAGEEWVKSKDCEIEIRVEGGISQYQFAVFQRDSANTEENPVVSLSWGDEEGEKLRWDKNGKDLLPFGTFQSFSLERGASLLMRADPPEQRDSFHYILCIRKNE